MIMVCKLRLSMVIFVGSLGSVSPSYLFPCVPYRREKAFTKERQCVFIICKLILFEILFNYIGGDIWRYCNNAKEYKHSIHKKLRGKENTKSASSGRKPYPFTHELFSQESYSCLFYSFISSSHKLFPTSTVFKNCFKRVKISESKALSFLSAQF